MCSRCWSRACRRHSSEVAVRRPFLELTPEPRLALVIAVLSPLWLIPGETGRVVAVGALVLALLAAIADALTLPGAADLTVERSMPTSIGIGDRAAGEYTIRSRWRLPLWVRLTDDLPTGVTSGTRVNVVPVASRGVARVAVPITGAVRGRFPLGAIALRVRTRVGLAARRLRWMPEDSILVTPSVSSVRRFRLLAVQHRL